MKAGQAHIMSRLKPNQTSQACSHHHWPLLAMSQSTTQASGAPRASPSSAPLTRSVTKIFQVLRLKPKRSSMTKVR